MGPTWPERIYGLGDAWTGGLLSGLDNFVHRDVLGRDVDFRKTAARGQTGVHRDFLAFPEAFAGSAQQFLSMPTRFSGMLRKGEAGASPPAVQQRPFADDYGRRASGPDGSPLAVDIEGRPLVARFVAGRRTVGGVDQGLGENEIGLLAGEIASSVRAVPRSELPRKAIGSYEPRNNAIRIADDLNPTDATVALAHETGHAIDTLSSAGVSAKAAPTQARQVYHEGAIGAREPSSRKWLGPEHYGYSGAAVDRELAAEAVRAYLMNPNYIKTTAPKLAKAIRAAVNSDPALNRTIQFNAPIAPFVGLGAGAYAISPYGLEE